ncbi:DUF4158 domain-containing protein [Saccharopolyspora elongata]|uniref:hypothetical protein n=1 Tax=Saccharopolyspora elongata TaxID=2530387 RepID=UPI001A9F1C60|nr:hypothetical protein [Saccharopolyspora elongata]
MDGSDVVERERPELERHGGTLDQHATLPERCEAGANPTGCAGAKKCHELEADHGRNPREDSPADLINVALEELVRARRELPGFTTLDKMVSAIRTETNTELFALVLDAVEFLRFGPASGSDPKIRGPPQSVPRRSVPTASRRSPARSADGGTAPDEAPAICLTQNALR